MPITWLEQFNGQGLGRDENGDTRTRRWIAAGAVTPQEALTDVGFPVAYNDAHPSDAALKVRRIRVNTSGFALQDVTAEYVRPEDGDGHPEEDDVTKPLVFNWQTVQENLPVDRDATTANSGMGNAILSSAGRAINGITRTKNYKRLTITRWETSYNLNQALAYENTVNSGTFEGADAGEVKCSIIQPNQSITIASALVGIDYAFDFKKEEIWGADPWQLQLLDKDSYAVADGKTRRIVTASGEPVTDALLNGLGVPIDTTLTYVDDAGATVASPSWTAGSTPTGATIITVGGLKFLRWLTLPLQNFNSLGF